MATRAIHVDGDTGLTELIGRLTDDSKRLVSDEVRLAKLEMASSIHRAQRGALWIAVAIGVGTIALVAFTILLTVLFGRLTGELWIGAFITGALELMIGGWMVYHGVHVLGHTSYTLDSTRGEIKDTVAWAHRV